MASIRSRDTKPELLVRSFLHRRGFRFRVADRRLPGRPDIVLPKYRSVVFVHGCFWHQHTGCRFAVLPKANGPFWRAKLSRNVERDQECASALRQDGWRVDVVWECELAPRTLQRLAKRIARRRTIV